MPFRSDIEVDWTSSPRVITIHAPSITVTIQDLVDTCRTLEADPVRIDEDHLVDPSGKQRLAVGMYVGITLLLRNAVISFEARPGPVWAKCRIAGGNLVAQDLLGNYIDPVLEQAFTSVVLELSTSAALLSGSGGLTPADVTQAVWDVQADDHVAAGTTGRQAKDTKVLGQQNYASIEDVLDLVEDLHNEAFGKWTLDPVAGTLTLYRADGTVLQIFQLTSTPKTVPAYVGRTPTI